MSRVWLITGCSSGFGRLLAERLLNEGENVVATARALQSLHDLGRDRPERMLQLTLDVRDAGQIRAAVAAALERVGRLDVLVTNAGYGYFGTQEEGELAEVREMYETNVFGLIAMTQAVLPHMRERGAGTVVNLSSVAGRMATPRGGFYQSSKWAVEALSEALSLETASFGVRVVVIEPGAYLTDFNVRSARQSPAETDPASPYATIRARWIANASAAIFVRRQDPAEVVQGIIDAVNSPLRFVRLPLGEDAVRIVAKREELTSTEFVEWMRGVYHHEGKG